MFDAKKEVSKLCTHQTRNASLNCRGLEITLFFGGLEDGMMAFSDMQDVSFRRGPQWVDPQISRFFKGKSQPQSQDGFLLGRNIELRL